MQRPQRWINGGICTKCGVDKPATEFYKDYASCKACTRTHMRNLWYQQRGIEPPAEVRPRRGSGPSLQPWINGGICSVCKIQQPPEGFYRNSCQCKGCRGKVATAYRVANLPLVAWRVKVRKRAALHGVTVKHYLEHGEPPIATRCHICGVLATDPRNGVAKNAAPRSLSRDHDHATGEYRGWLCSNCNNGLGRFADNPDWLRRAAFYLEGTLPSS